MSEPALPRWRIALRYLNPRNWWWPTEWWRRAALVLLYVLVPLMAVDFFFPPPLTRFQEVSGVVMDRRGAVLRVFHRRRQVAHACACRRAGSGLCLGADGV